jgi:ATP-dependent protease ClpP protease subunit
MKWFTAKALGDRKAEVVIDKVIASDWEPDWLVDFFGEKSARLFIEEIDALGDLDEIHLKLNTPGGDVYSGIRITNYLINHKAKVHVTVQGIAASIGSVIMLAGDTRTMGIGTQVMVHSPATGLCGYFTEAKLIEHADQLAKVETSIVDIYVARTGKTEDEIRSLLAKGDVYMAASEAIEWGFATETDESLPAVAMADPRQFQAQVKMQTEMQALRDQLTGAAQTKTDLQAKLDTTTAELEALRNPAAAGADYVIEACDKAQLPVLAVAMIKERLPEATVVQRLALAAKVRDIAKAGGIETDALVAHINDPIKMMQVAITEAKAAGDQNLNPHHINNTQNHADGWSAAFKKTTK